MVNRILVIAGATCSGKSRLAIQLAQKLNGEIVSADSATLYQKLDIGTAKPSKQEQVTIPHHMIDILPPQQSYSVFDYITQAKPIVDNLLSQNKTVILCGGTGLYIKSLLYKNSITPYNFDQNIRTHWTQELQSKGKEYVYQYLQQIDIETANKLSPNDTRRVIRAIEIYQTTGQKKSQMIQQDGSKNYTFDFFVLDKDRAELYQDINTRVDQMVNNGLFDEVKSLYSYKDCQSMQSIGYKEVIQFLDGQLSYDDTIQLIKKNTRNYAKRQLTFFRHCSDAIFLTAQNLSQRFAI